MERLQVTAGSYDLRPAHAAMQRFVDANILPGISAAVLVGRDLVDVKCVGWADKEAQIPLRPDHIFRAFSSTKLITSCAALLLLEEGRFDLDDPVERFIPQLASRRVLRRDATSLADTEPADRPITIRHLMSHTAGLSYGLFDPGTMMFNAYTERRVRNPATTLADMVDVLADLPLAYHPGTSWEYSVATDVLARLVEIVSGECFDAFLHSRIFAPLGMTDTGFVVPMQSQNRIVAFYKGPDMLDPMKPGLIRTDDAPAYLRSVPRLSGGDGLVSTLPDMVALVRGLLPGGKTLLKPETIALLSTNELAEGVQLAFPGIGVLDGRGHGLAGAVIIEPAKHDDRDAQGEMFWGGYAGTQWWISPKANVAGVMMAQRHMSFLHPFAFAFKRLAYEAVRRAGKSA